MSRYDGVYGHPLNGVPDEILAAARQVLSHAAICGDLDDDMAEPLADAVVSALVPWLQLPT